jgi:LAO/AO transport system kinase
MLSAARDGDQRVLARLLSLVEDGSELLPQIMRQLAPDTGRAQVLGLTGSPGVGKSSTTNAVISRLRGRDQRVGVLAVDPSSPFSGGALLGDRVRMQQHATDPGVFIRSMAARGHLGGLAAATGRAVSVLDATGYQVVIVETVGVGQSEVEVAGTADTVVVLLAPGMGDGVQVAKAGILEIGDIFAVNKADRDGADTAVRELRHMLGLVPPVPGGWQRPVLKTVASTGEGIDALVAAVEDHHQWALASGELARRRRRRAAAEIEAVILGRLRGRAESAERTDLLGDLAQQVATGRLDAYRAADQLLSGAATPTAGR